MSSINFNMARAAGFGALKVLFTPRRILFCLFGLLLLAGAFLFAGDSDGDGFVTLRPSDIADNGNYSLGRVAGFSGEGILTVNRGGAVQFLRGMARRCSSLAAPPADQTVVLELTALLLCFSLYFANLVVIKSKPVILSDIQGGAASVRAAPRF
ncbi:MAG: hypothetical protein PHI85_08910 [Victivallaceae bacterium]|nr:hypothetical protein [Victivallaceae bacterium]